jgi:uncharacterized membrane protein YfcA
VSLGAFLGAKFMSKTKIEWIKPGFGVIMLAFAFQLIVKLIHF